MQVSVILGHPEQGSFNHAIANSIIHTLKKMVIRFIFMTCMQKSLIQFYLQMKYLKMR